jgi:hypothetical protein
VLAMVKPEVAKWQTVREGLQDNAWVLDLADRGALGAHDGLVFQTLGCARNHDSEQRARLMLSPGVVSPGSGCYWYIVLSFSLQRRCQELRKWCLPPSTLSCMHS